MANDNSIPPAVQESFNHDAAADHSVTAEHAAETETAMEAAQALEPGTDFETTTTMQVDLSIERYDVLDAHDERWNRERDRLTAKPVEAPSLDLGGDSGRSIQKEYTERRNLWEAHRDSINRLFDRQVADVRALGTTMSDHFQDASEPAPEPEQDLANALDLADAATAENANENAERRQSSVRIEFHKQVRTTTRSL